MDARGRATLRAITTSRDLYLRVTAMDPGDRALGDYLRALHDQLAPFASRPSLSAEAPDSG